MKTRVLKLIIGASTALATLSMLGQPQRGAQQPPAIAIPSNPTAEEALALALLGPDGEYAAYAEYTAIVQQFGAVQPYATILLAEQRHIAALKQHFELRGLAVPENPYLGKVQVPATLKAAAEAGIAAEERNVAMYDQLINRISDQPDLVRVFTHLQWASREHHLPAFQAAAAKDGQLGIGEFTCGMGRSKGCGGPPPWAGGRGGPGFGQGKCSGACPLTQPTSGTATGIPRRGYRHGAVGQSQGQ